MTRERYLKKRAHLCLLILQINKEKGYSTDADLKKGYKAMFKNKSLPNFKKGPYNSYKEAYEDLYRVLMPLVNSVKA